MKAACVCIAASLAAVILSGCGDSGPPPPPPAPPAPPPPPPPPPSPPPDPAQLWEQHYDHGTPVSDQAIAPSNGDYNTALQELNLEDVFADIKQVMKTSDENWPADFENYGPFFVRLAWHCSGTYRSTDGKGGCTGGVQRFEPVRSWDDNTNLDKARALLSPIKDKYGDKLSWGDLIIAAGTTAMREMGTPLQQFCAGRVDDPDGTNGLPLGPSAEQRQDYPCPVEGHCEKPLGSTTIGLIYLNPEGPVNTSTGLPNPDPVLSAADIRDAFGRMNNTDRATVALIGGGHAFGKSHGACNLEGAQGLTPAEAYSRSEKFAWQGLCGEGSEKGKGLNTFTSGFEGSFTKNPLQWDNEYFDLLVNRDWERFIGPGGHNQWKITNPQAGEEDLLRLTSDVALIEDEDYLAIAREFANDLHAFDEAFDAAWFELTHRGGVWSPNAKCDHGEVPQWILDQSNNRMLDTDVVAV